MSKAAEQWDAFAAEVRNHIENYAVPQYGDIDTELAKDWESPACVHQAQTYLARFGRSVRQDEEKLDMLKTAHWVQKAWTKFKGGTDA